MFNKGSRSTDSNPEEQHTDRRRSIPYGEDGKPPFLTMKAISMGLLVGMGGMCWGFDTGQISGFLEMDDFKYQFGDIRDDGPPTLSPLRVAIIVALLSIGTLLGALAAGPLANQEKVGRKYSITIWSFVLAIGNAFQVGSQFPHWYVMLIGRIVAGIGVGGLSVVTPAFTSESAPAHIRGATVSCYNLFVTLGQVVANCTNFGTNELTGSIQWRLPIALGWVWCLVLGVGVLFFPETPRHSFRHGKTDLAMRTMAGYYGISPDHSYIRKQAEEMRLKLALEEESKAGFMETFTAPRMLYRILLGSAVMMWQQLVGINFFMYFGTSLFSSVGIPNPFITAIILGAVNCIGTIPGLYLVERFGRRGCLYISGILNCIFFLVYASLGRFALNPGSGGFAGEPEENDQTTGYLMIVFACLFIFTFAATWGPMAWTVISEIFPSQFRSVGIAVSCASCWIFNFYVAFSTSFVIDAVGFSYGYFFAACNAAAALTIFFFFPETSGRTLEEIDTMFLLKIKPWRSSKWVPPAPEDMDEADRRRMSAAGKMPMDAGEKHADGSSSEDMVHLENARQV